jgi:hypothetical protein
MIPLIPIGIGLASFIIGRLTAPSHGELMKLLLSILEHPAVFLLGLALGYLAPSNVSTVASNALSALQWLKNKL